MLFNSFQYLALLLATVLLRWTLPSRARIWFLLGASYLFYASWGPIYVLLLAGVSLASFAASLALERFPDRRREVVAVAVTGLVGTLGYFKYTGFLFAQLRELGLAVGHVSIVLPLGISFFTFTAISYVIDVYRGEKAERSLSVHLTFIAFFPHLVAGPIVRKREISEQLRRLDRPFDPGRFSTGVLLVLVGLFEKMVLADGLSGMSDAVFAGPTQFSSLGVALGVVSYAGQILCDFAGYTHVGIGSAKLLGIDFPPNFNQPYLSSSPADFWRRWHMTLSRWLRDYLWVAVGGRRREPVFRYLTPILTMTIAGLWHGAAWTFVAWGAYHGVLLSLHQAWVRGTARIPGFEEIRDRLSYRALATVLTLVVVLLGWIPFRATSFEGAFAMLARIAGATGTSLGAQWDKPLYLLAVLAVAHAAGPRAFAWYERAPAPIQGIVWFGLLAGIYLFAAPPAEFIYFAF